MLDKFSKALEESERFFSAKKKARIVAWQQIKRRLRAIYDINLNRPIPARIIGLLKSLSVD